MIIMNYQTPSNIATKMCKELKQDIKKEIDKTTIIMENQNTSFTIRSRGQDKAKMHLKMNITSMLTKI